jgi:hypothetical protein
MELGEPYVHETGQPTHYLNEYKNFRQNAFFWGGG